MDGRAKAMVVTSGRLHAVNYMQGFQRYIAEKGYDDIRPLVAFSGTVHDPYTGEDFTEPGMNIDVVTGKSISEAALPGPLCVARLSNPAGGGEVPDGFRSAAVAGDVRGQATGRRAGGADAFEAQPHGAGQGAALRAGLRERSREHPSRLRAVLRPHRVAGGVRPAPARRAEIRVGPDAGLPLVGGRGLCAGLLFCPGFSSGKRTMRGWKRHSSPLGTDSQSSTTRTRRSFTNACKRS